MLIIFLGISLQLPLAFGEETDPLAGVGKLATDWVKTRAETTRLDTDWKTQRHLLESTVDGLTERAQTLEEKRDLLQAKTAKDREELATLTTSLTASSANLQAVETRAQAMSTRLIQLRSSLPPRLSTALELSYRSLGDPALAVSARMQLNMTVLNRCLQFNRSITCEEEALNLDGSKDPRILEVVYWGLSHGYALDRTSGKAWLGRPGSQGWQWEPHPEAVPSVAELIAIYHDKADPNFLIVPASVGHPAGEPAK